MRDYGLASALLTDRRHSSCLIVPLGGIHLVGAIIIIWVALAQELTDAAPATCRQMSDWPARIRMAVRVSLPVSVLLMVLMVLLL